MPKKAIGTEPETIQDLVTTSTRPTFQGLAEANSIVRLYAAITNPMNLNFSPVPVFPNNFVTIGETVAIPTDGTNAFPNGQWTLQSTVDLNDPRFFLPTDGLRTLIVLNDRATSEDWTLALIRPAEPSLSVLQITGAEENLPFVEEPGSA